MSLVGLPSYCASSSSVRRLVVRGRVDAVIVSTGLRCADGHVTPVVNGREGCKDQAAFFGCLAPCGRSDSKASGILHETV